VVVTLDCYSFVTSVPIDNRHWRAHGLFAVFGDRLRSWEVAEDMDLLARRWLLGGVALAEAAASVVQALSLACWQDRAAAAADPGYGSNFGGFLCGGRRFGPVLGSCR